MSIERELTQFVETRLLQGNEDGVDREESLIDRGVIDSIGLMQLISFVEERWNVRVPDHRVTPDDFQSVAAIEALVADLREKGSEA